MQQKIKSDTFLTEWYVYLYPFYFQTLMDRNPDSLDQLKDPECLGHNRSPETDIRPRCLRKAVEAMFVERYNMTLIYNDEVSIG